MTSPRDNTTAGQRIASSLNLAARGKMVRRFRLRMVSSDQRSVMHSAFCSHQGYWSVPFPDQAKNTIVLITLVFWGLHKHTRYNDKSLNMVNSNLEILNPKRNSCSPIIHLPIRRYSLMAGFRYGAILPHRCHVWGGGR